MFSYLKNSPLPFALVFFLFVSDIFKQKRMGGGRSGEDKSQTKRKLVGTKTCFMFPRWVLFYVAWVLVATKAKKKKVTISKKRKNINEENKNIKEKERYFFKIFI